MEQKNAFLSDLGLEIQTVFNDKIAHWQMGLDLSAHQKDGQMSVTANSPNPNDRGGYSAEFERLAKIFELSSFTLEAVFIPEDLFDFDNSNAEGRALPNLRNQTTRPLQKEAFWENKKPPITDIGYQMPEMERPKLENEAKKPQYTEGGHTPPTVSYFGFGVADTRQIQPKFDSKNPADTEGGHPIFFEKRQTDIDDRMPSSEPKSFDKSVFQQKTKVDEVQTVVNNAIWQNPLGSLGTFAALSNSITPTTANAESIFLPNSPNEVDKKSTDDRTDDTTDFFVKKNLQFAAPIVHQRHDTFEDDIQQTRTNNTFVFDNTYTHDAPNKTVFHETEMENTEFLPIENDTTSLDLDTMTDDILEALTDRIRRDFHRFYP